MAIGTYDYASVCDFWQFEFAEGVDGKSAWVDLVFGAMTAICMLGGVIKIVLAKSRWSLPQLQGLRVSR